MRAEAHVTLPINRTGANAGYEAARAYLRGRIAVAQDLAVGDGHDEARALLANLQPEIAGADDDIVALFFQAYAIANRRARLVEQSFTAFQKALRAARRSTKASLQQVVLVNYGTALAQDGRVKLGVTLIGKALEIETGPFQRLAMLVNYAEALFTAGRLDRAAEALHEFHDLYGRHPRGDYMLAAIVTGIPLGVMLDDKRLLRWCSDPALLELAFVRPGDYQGLGQAAEAFCFLYEHSGRRKDHDAILNRAVEALPSLDAGLGLALRAARFGSAEQVLRIKGMMDQHCVGDGALVRAYRALYDSFLAARHRSTQRAKKLALQAVADLAGLDRPLLEALALEAAGMGDAADQLCRKCGSKTGALRLNWRGRALPRRIGAELTAREREVAELAAEGMADRSIARALGLSERTVQCHCRAIFAKLGIRSRWQLTMLPGEAPPE